MMIELGFPYELVTRVMVCVRTVSYAILVHGTHLAPFQAKKGLR